MLIVECSLAKGIHRRRVHIVKRLVFAAHCPAKRVGAGAAAGYADDRRDLDRGTAEGTDAGDRAGVGGEPRSPPDRVDARRDQLRGVRSRRAARAADPHDSGRRDGRRRRRKRRQSPPRATPESRKRGRSPRGPRVEGASRGNRWPLFGFTKSRNCSTRPARKWWRC